MEGREGARCLIAREWRFYAFLAKWPRIQQPSDIDTLRSAHSWNKFMAQRSWKFLIFAGPDLLSVLVQVVKLIFSVLSIDSIEKCMETK